MLEQEKATLEPVRILGRQIGRELTRAEMDLVGGADGENPEIAPGDTQDHGGTCTHEADCD